MVRGSFAVLPALFVAMTTAGSTCAESADPPSKAPTGLAAKRLPKSAVELKPNIAVSSVWKTFDGATFTPGDSPVGVGEWVAFVCDVRLVLNPPPGWKMAWYVDGVKLCGEIYSAGPRCEWAWPWTNHSNSQLALDWVAKGVGSHTFRCAVDIDDAVDEAKEDDNSKTMTFEVRAPLTPIHRDRFLTTAPLPGPKRLVPVERRPD